MLGMQFGIVRRSTVRSALLALGCIAGGVAALPSAATGSVAESQVALSLVQFNLRDEKVVQGGCLGTIAYVGAAPGCQDVLDEVGMNAPTWEPRPEDVIGLGLEPQFGTASEGAHCVTKAYEDTFNWVSVRWNGKSYAIGNCADGWVVDVQHPHAKEGYSGGYVNGNVQRCSWVKGSNLRSNGGTGANPCPSSGSYMTLSSFARYFNCERGADDCNNRDGFPVRTVQSCPMYANVQPWRNPATPTDQLRTIPTGAQFEGAPRLKWRYLAKYSDYVLVRDRATADGRGNWGFVPLSCLEQPLPGPHHAP